jgi:alpha-L-fucosidase
MQVSRRNVLRSLVPGIAAGSVSAASQKESKFKPDWESLKQYRCPEWFRDAKFGIWAHWGPQGAPMQGDWYARNMYIQGTRHYEFHLKHYGHPSQVGFKDIIPLWTAKNWEPEFLIRKYKRAGARYFAAMGVHCDNFDCWNSKHHRWNSVNYGPQRDIVGIWAKVARDHGLRFAVSEHLAWSYDWFNVNKNSDRTGPFAGIPYDGVDPRNRDLYHEPHLENTANYPLNPSSIFTRSWFVRVKDLIDQHRPDLVYTDGGVFGQAGLNVMAHYYNANMSWNGGEQQGVYTIKNHGRTGKFGEYVEGVATQDLERGLAAGIMPEPFQTDTCLGQWQYYNDFKYKKAIDVIHMLVDVVSKNGTMMLSVPQMPDGTLDSEEESILHDITTWMRMNSEAIYDTRPWKKFGEGSTATPSGLMSERKRKPFTVDDVRFTSKGSKIYMFVMGKPEKDLTIASLGSNASLLPKVENIRVLGSDEKLNWNISGEHLTISRPNFLPAEFATVFEIA